MMKLRRKIMTDNDRVVTPFLHQKQIVLAPSFYPTCNNFMLAGGYGCGKSFSIVLCILDIVRRYNGYHVAVGVGSTTITLIEKTILIDLTIMLKKSGSRFSYDGQAHIFTIGTIDFFFIATIQPGDIYAFNFNIFLCDEIDELPQSKVIAANKAMKERTRIRLPDGREPYTMYFTTVQGYRGLYQLVQEMKQTKQKYVLVRGLTKNNTALAPSYYKNLYAIYDDNERLAYLEGRFVNLRTGRVYPDFDENVHVCADIEITPDDVIMIGQDLNEGFSKAVAVVKRDKRLYAVYAWSFPDIGSAPAIMRRTFPNNPIQWYPDASGKGIIRGYRDEIIANGIECRIGTSNPGIIDRVFYVNKLFRSGLMSVCRSNTDILTDALKIRQYAENGVPEKGKGEKAPDHICDALEYVIYRIVRSDADFMGLKELSREEIKENGYIRTIDRNGNQSAL